MTYTNTDIDAAFANGVYLVAGSNQANHVMSISNFKVTHSVWNKYTGSGFVTTAVEHADDSVVITGKAAAYTSEKIDVKEGTKISFDVEFETIGTNLIQTGFALTDKADTYYYSGTSNSVAVELVSLGDSKMTAGHAYAVGGGRTSGNDSTEITTNRNDIVGTTYTIAFEKQASGWIMTATDNAGHTKEMTYTNTDIDAAFANGVYLVVGSNQANHVMSVSNLKVEQKLADATAVASTDVNKMHMASPVVMTASLSNSLVDKASWTYYEGGQSFANKIGNPYTNDKFDYFGLPYADKDIRTIGWSDLQLFEVHETDDIRHDNQLNSGETTGNLYGYMTLQNAGYDYAAFVKVNTATQKLEFFTPAGLSAEITEEEMVLSKMPGGNNGFEIFWDETSGLYWLVTTEDTDSTSDSKETRVAIYYGTNAYDWRSAGVVAELSGDARVSAVVEGQQLVITAINDDVVQYTVPNFRELVGFSGLGDWSQIKIRGTSSGYSVVEDDDLITLSNFGAATCNQKVDVAEGTQISFKVKGTTLVAGQVFAVGLIDTYGSFPGRINDSTYFTGNGVVASIATFSNNNGAVIRYASVETAKYNIDTTNIAKETGNSIPNTIAMTDNEITFTFTKRSQTISGVAYSWTIEWVEANGNTTGSYNLKASDVPDNLFDNGAYIFAGCRTGGACVYEISDVTVTQPLVGDVNHDGEINILDIAAIDYGIRVPSSVASYEKHVYNVDEDENVTIDYKDVNAIREDVLAH